MKRRYDPRDMRWSIPTLNITAAGDRKPSQWPSITIRAMGCASHFSDSLIACNKSYNTSLQPFNERYEWFNTTQNMVIADPQITVLNPYVGGAFQQATSGVTMTS
jgi:hypothetical protein